MIAGTLSTAIAASCMLVTGFGFHTKEAAAFCLNPRLLLPTTYPATCTQDHAPKITSGLANKPAAAADATSERVQGMRTRLSMGFSFTFPTFGKPKQVNIISVVDGLLSVQYSGCATV